MNNNYPDVLPEPWFTLATGVGLTLLVLPFLVAACLASIGVSELIKRI